MITKTNTSTARGPISTTVDAGLRAHMNSVYNTMTKGLAITGAVSWAVGSSDALLSLFRNPETLEPNILGWVVMFAPLIMLIGFGGAVMRASAAMAQTMFYVFSAVMGLSMAWIFAAYTGMSIAQTFFVTAGAFAGLSLWGYTTKKDISGWGSFLIMGVIGLILASIVNIFLGSGAMAFAISVIGVFLFAGLTAYDTQKIKTDYIQHARSMDQEWLAKAGIMGALSLYLDFVNLFQFLLSFLGNRE